MEPPPARALGNYFLAACFLRSAQYAVMRSDTAFFSATVLGRRLLSDLTSGLLFAATVVLLVEEERRDVDGGDRATDAPRMRSTSVNALSSAWRRSISLWRSAMACAMAFMAMERIGPHRRAGALAVDRGRRPGAEDADVRALRSAREVWIVDVVDDHVEVRVLVDGAYR